MHVKQHRPIMKLVPLFVVYFEQKYQAVVNVCAIYSGSVFSEHGNKMDTLILAVKSDCSNAPPW